VSQKSIQALPVLLISLSSQPKHISFLIYIMSASSQVTTPYNSSGAIAHVNFRVRCETLGFGEDVYLIEHADTQMQTVRSRSKKEKEVILLLS
jgi:hypothetical protein